MGGIAIIFIISNYLVTFRYQHGEVKMSWFEFKIETSSQRRSCVPKSLKLNFLNFVFQTFLAKDQIPELNLPPMA